MPRRVIPLNEKKGEWNIRHISTCRTVNESLRVPFFHQRNAIFSLIIYFYDESDFEAARKTSRKRFSCFPIENRLKTKKTKRSEWMLCKRVWWNRFEILRIIAETESNWMLLALRMKQAQMTSLWLHLLRIWKGIRNLCDLNWRICKFKKLN